MKPGQEFQQSWRQEYISSKKGCTARMSHGRELAQCSPPSEQAAPVGDPISIQLHPDPSHGPKLRALGEGEGTGFGYSTEKPVNLCLGYSEMRDYSPRARAQHRHYLQL